MYYPDATFRVVVCGVSDDAVADLTTHLDEGVDIRIATGGEEIRSHLDECACLVLGGGCAGAIDAEFRETIRDYSPELPVIAILEDDPGTLRRISDATPVRYLPPDADPGVLADYVHDAIADYERRRERRHHSTILESMFRQFPYTMYVKDEQARHRMMTDIPGTPDPDEVLGKTDVEVYGNEPEVRTWYQDDLDVIESGSPVIEREERFEEGNVTVWTESTKVPWHDGGRVRGLVGITLDVTERNTHGQMY